MIKVFSCFSDVVRNRGRLAAILIFTTDCGNVSKCPPDLLWGEDKEVQVIEGSTLVVLV